MEALPGGGFAPILERCNEAGGALVSVRSDGSPSAPGSNDIGFRTFSNVSPAPLMPIEIRRQR
jgi:hypothetical protein